MPAIIEMLAIAALIITVVAGLFQLFDRFTKTKKKPDE